MTGNGGQCWHVYVRDDRAERTRRRIVGCIHFAPSRKWVWADSIKEVKSEALGKRVAREGKNTLDTTEAVKKHDYLEQGSAYRDDEALKIVGQMDMAFMVQIPGAGRYRAELVAQTLERLISNDVDRAVIRESAKPPQGSLEIDASQLQRAIAAYSQTQ